MRWLPLLLCISLVLVLPTASSEAAADDYDYKLRSVDSFETTVEETSKFGNWTSFAYVMGTGASGFVDLTDSTMTHGYHSVRINASDTTGGDPTGMSWVSTGIKYASNESLDLFHFDRITFDYKLNQSDWVGKCFLRQWNDTTEVDRITIDLFGIWWQRLTIDPDWKSNATWFELEIYLWLYFETGGSQPPDWCELFVDNFRVLSGEVPVRVRYWNLYTGLGYYAEKLLAKYYTFEEGWVDIWQNEFIAYKGDEILISVTDIFGRNVWTGMVSIDQSPVYVDVLAPIVTVHIVKPDWYNESVPLEWRITCLPWGPDGTAGMTLPAIGFEFEVLAGWYNLAWLENGIVSAGNQSFLVDGNATEHRGTMILSDLTIPIDPDYEVLIEGDDGRIFDVRSVDDLVALLAALYDDIRVKAALLISGMTGIALAIWRLNKKASERIYVPRRGE